MVRASRSSTPLPLAGTRVSMSVDVPHVVLDTGSGLCTEYLTACAGIATFCSCGQGAPTTMTHARPNLFGNVAMGYALQPYVHDNDRIIIALGSDATDADFDRVVDGIEQGLGAYGVYGFICSKEVARTGEDATTFVVQATGTYGRAALYQQHRSYNSGNYAAPGGAAGRRGASTTTTSRVGASHSNASRSTGASASTPRRAQGGSTQGNTGIPSYSRTAGGGGGYNSGYQTGRH